MVLPRSNKACILCNGTLSFHTLPELSPAAGHKSLPGCIWIGAQDLDTVRKSEEDGDIIMITTPRKIRLARLTSDSRPSLRKDIEFPNCIAATRRSGLACVADGLSYALLDVDNQQKIPLFPISSIDHVPSPVAERQIEDITVSGGQLGRSSSVAHRRPELEEKGAHSRATSLGNLMSSQFQGNGRASSRGRSGLNTPELGERSLSPNTPSKALSPSRPLSFGGSPDRGTPTPDKPLPPTPGENGSPKKLSIDQRHNTKLKPHVLSPLPTEFLLTTGTGEKEPGVGVFVNSDGDVVPRGTLEFSRYPSAVVLDGGDPSIVTPDAPVPNMDGYCLAAIQRRNGERTQGLEIQRWDVPSEQKSWLILRKTKQTEENTGPDDSEIGLTTTHSAFKLTLSEIAQTLKLRRFRPKGSSGSVEESVLASEVERNLQEDGFAYRFGYSFAHIATWSGTSVFWVIRNPILIRLDAAIEQILVSSQETRLDQGRLIKLAKSIRNQEVRSEADFVSLDYIRQKISIILFADLAFNRGDVNPQLDEQLLMDGGTDPRILLHMVPLLTDDIVESDSGIWIHCGLVDLMKNRLASASISLDPDEFTSRPEEFDMLGLVKRYLSAWRQKKGFGSITDETQVFATVDAALLHVLLHQDQQSNTGFGGSASLRAELYAVVDHNVDCWDRAIQLLEEYHRLYVLSRLYQSRRMGRQVLNSWRRILEGERDEGGEFTDGENEVRKYLGKTKDASLVEEYGAWLANRNAVLGVQVFTDDNARVKLPPSQIVKLLRQKAPESVKVYLEHLVFGKKNVQYANELITFYLDNVLSVLESSAEAKSMLSDSYTTYRALEEPKPTYRQFITDNDTSTSWWQDRLRLLELLGGSHGAGFSYDILRVLERIEPFEDYLVPESIILDGRQGRHQQAIRLLTHGLGDYHTAINYCVLGGSSIFHPTSTQIQLEDVPSEEEQARLFKYLLTEFLKIVDERNRVERTSELLGRFGGWFEIEFVLANIPDSWSIDILSDFLIGALRRLVHEKTEASIVKALSGAENLRISAEFVEKVERLGSHIIPAMDTPTSM